MFKHRRAQSTFNEATRRAKPGTTQTAVGYQGSGNLHAVLKLRIYDRTQAVHYRRGFVDVGSTSRILADGLRNT